MRKTSLAVLTLALGLSACDGLGAAVVGPLPEPEPGTGPRMCLVDPCDVYLSDEPELWTPPADLTAEAACPEVAHYTLRGDAALHPDALIENLLVPPEVGEGPLELRCADITIEVPDTAPSFELDLRAITLLGVRVLVSSEISGAVLLGTVGTVTASEFTMLGPIDVVADRALVWGAQINFERSLQRAPAGSLLALDSQFVRFTTTGEGTLSVRRSSLREAHLRAARLTSELSPWANIFARVDTVEVFEASIFEGHIEADHFIAAAGSIGYSELIHCREVILAAVTFSHSRIGPTGVPVRVSEGFIRGSYIEADLVGSITVAQSGLLGRSIDLVSGAIYTSALCGVEFLGVEHGVVACIRCDEGAPEDICTSSHAEPACPGFETAMCSRGERFSTIPQDLMGI